MLQLLGPGGCGKTTHLEALRRRFPGAPLWAWSTRDGWPPMPRGEPLFVDDAHELAGRAWPRLVCGRRAVVAATRTDLGAVPGHPGTSPGEAGPLVRGGGVELLTVQVADRVTPADIHRMVRRRLEWARRGPGPIPSVADTLVAALVARHGRDLRGLTDELYRHVQEHPGVAS